MKSENKNQITVEDLLRLKRAERPPAEFWSQFERELRAKQLAAIMVKRPWWRTLPHRAFAGLARYHLPLGASAVLALTFISVREYQVAAPERGLVPNLGHAVAVSTPAFSESDESVSSLRSGVGSPAVAAVLAAADVSAPVMSEEASVASDSEARAPEPQVLAGDVSAMNALVGGAAPAERGLSPSARSIAENFAAVQGQEAPLPRSLLGARQGFESRVLPARAVDPLAQVVPPSEVRRSRYLGTALPISTTASIPVSRSSERLASRLSDDRLYESISRLDVGGNHVALKF